MPLKLTTEQRFWPKVNRGGPNGCWIWEACLSSKGGYGLFTNFKLGMAHRYAYELLVGPIHEGLQIDHLCRVRACVNPAHMEAVTNKENLLRGYGATAINARKTHCVRGHEFTPENTWWDKRWNPWGRICKACRYLWRKEHIDTVRIADRNRMRIRRAKLKLLR